MGCTHCIDKAKGVNAKPLHHAQTARDGPIRHDPHQGVLGALRHQAGKVPEGIVCAGRLGHLVMRLGLQRMDQIREFDRVLDEEYRHVVAHQVVISFWRIELKFDGEYPGIAHCIGRTARACHG